MMLTSLFFSMVATSGVISGFQEKINARSWFQTQYSELPVVKISLAGDAKEYYSWGTQLRYEISVSDAEDGASEYGEIDDRSVLLEIEFVPGNPPSRSIEALIAKRRGEGLKGLTLIKNSTCFGCHADKTRLAGPSFGEIADRYRNGERAKELRNHIINGSSGVWGSLEMPAHPDITETEAAEIVDYILKQGGNKNSWVYPGLEGAFKIVARPENVSEGVYVLTASYTSRSGRRGEHSIVMRIK